MERYYVIRTMMGERHHGEDSGWLAVAASPESKDRIGMAMQCGPPAGTKPVLRARYQLTIRGNLLTGEWILDGSEFTLAPESPA